MFAKLITIILFLLVAISLSVAFGKSDPAQREQAHNSLVLPAASVVYSQQASDTPLQHQSSQVGYDRYASDYDQYVWDNFTLNATGVISELTWRGFYRTGGYWGGGVVDFTLAIYPSAVADTEPDHLHPPLVQYTVGSNAGETPVWALGSLVLSMHDYHFALPAPFTATAGVKYWVQIEGIQNGPADWGVVAGTGGDGFHFFAIPGSGDFRFGSAPGDAAFTLLGLPGEVKNTRLAAVTINGPTVGAISASYTFIATIDPITATTPTTYTWSPPPASGQGAPAARHTWLTPGTKSITVTAENAVSAVSHTQIVHIYSPLTSVVISGPTAGVVNTAYTLTVTISPITATPPISYTWSPPPRSGQSTLVATYTWLTPGNKSITVTVGNAISTVSDTNTLTITGQICLYLPVILKQLPADERLSQPDF